MKKSIFYKTVDILLAIAEKCHMTYNEVNVVLWYLVLPIIWLLLLRQWIIALVYGGIWGILMLVFGFHDLCDTVFKKSQDFLLLFRKVGWDYELASVIICLLVPVLITVLILWLK